MRDQSVAFRLKRKERGRGATRGGAHDGKAHSIQGKHRAGAKVLRPAHTIHAGNGYDPATCGLEILLASSTRAPAVDHACERAVIGAGRWSLRKDYLAGGARTEDWSRR